MPISTPLTARLGIQHPILSAPMDVIAGARLTAAVSAAGGFGILGGGYGDEAWLRQETAKLAGASDPFGIGFITWSLEKQPALLDIALEARPRAIMLSFGDPKPFATRINSSGALLICQVQTIEHTREAVANDADVIVAQGAEGGGHGIARGTFALVPAVVDIARGTPVAAAGGVADGRGLAAALMLGADGVLLGTRFYASVEAAGFKSAKERIVAASGDRTIRGILFDIARRNVWPAPFAGRVLRNEFSERWRGREAELMQHPEEAERFAKARTSGDFDTAAVIAGEVVDLIGDIPPAAEIVERITREAATLLAGASNRYRASS